MKDAIKPRNPQGFRDFLPEAMLRRNAVLHTITEVFQRYGYEPLATPVLERHTTLFGNYGEDAEKLIYTARHGSSKREPLAMRYDLTVPLARVVAQHESQITFPFKRYHIAPVFRGERPQRGRYREFWQVDADIVGIAGISADAEIITLVARIMQRLGFPQFVIKINHRQLLSAIGAFAGVASHQLPGLYRSVDKFDKIGADGVRAELTERGISAEAARRMLELLQARQPGGNSLEHIAELIGKGDNGIEDLRRLGGLLEEAGIAKELYDFDFTLARGLGYYTGPIFETVISQPNLGSVTGGGRYDNLIGMFRRQSLPTTGVSFGLERIMDLMDKLRLHPAGQARTLVQLLVTVFSPETRAASLRFAEKMRAAGLNTEVYLDTRKLGRQFAHAEKKGIPLVAVLGPSEIEAGLVSLKRLRDGAQTQVTLAAAAASAAELLGNG